MIFKTSLVDFNKSNNCSLNIISLNMGLKKLFGKIDQHSIPPFFLLIKPELITQLCDIPVYLTLIIPLTKKNINTLF